MIKLRLEWKKEAREARYNARALAKRYKVSLRQLERLFRRTAGMGPQRLLKELRLQDAAALLSAGNSVKEAAAALGFKQPSHFSREFKRLYGFPPKQARMVVDFAIMSPIDTYMSPRDMHFLYATTGSGCVMPADAIHLQ